MGTWCWRLWAVQYVVFLIAHHLPWNALHHIHEQNPNWQKQRKTNFQWSSRHEVSQLVIMPPKWTQSAIMQSSQVITPKKGRHCSTSSWLSASGWPISYVATYNVRGGYIDGRGYRKGHQHWDFELREVFFKDIEFMVMPADKCTFATCTWGSLVGVIEFMPNFA